MVVVFVVVFVFFISHGLALLGGGTNRSSRTARKARPWLVVIIIYIEKKYFRRPQNYQFQVTEFQRKFSVWFFLIFTINQSIVQSYTTKFQSSLILIYKSLVSQPPQRQSQLNAYLCASIDYVDNNTYCHPTWSVLMAAGNDFRYDGYILCKNCRYPDNQHTEYQHG